MRKILNSELGRLTAEEFATSNRTPLIVVADNLRSLNNIGSLFRSADAFGIEKIYLCGICATPPNREIHKTALGAELTIQWEYVKECCDAIQSLKNLGYTIIVLEQVEGSVMLNQFTVDKSKKYAIVVGNEVNGVSQGVVNMCDTAIEIPQIGTKHSLNVSVAAGVILWDFFNQFNR